MSDHVIFALSTDLRETNVGVPGRDQGWRIEITTRVRSGFLDAAMFRYQKISDTEILFTGVCSPADLADYGTEPAAGLAFFRSDAAKLDFASRTVAYEIRDEILAELEVLCAEMARISGQLSPLRTVEITS